jgi:hypothetical protein
MVRNVSAQAEKCGSKSTTRFERGLGQQPYPLGVPELVIQGILRHLNVSTTATYYIKTATDDVRKAMKTLENGVTEAGGRRLVDRCNRTLRAHWRVNRCPILLPCSRA